MTLHVFGSRKKKTQHMRRPTRSNLSGWRHRKPSSRCEGGRGERGERERAVEGAAMGLKKKGRGEREGVFYVAFFSPAFFISSI